MKLRHYARLFFALFFLQVASGNAAPAYWLSDVDKIAPVSAGASGARFNPLGANTSASVWKAHWPEQSPSKRWNEEAIRLIVKYRVNPLRAVRALSYLHVTMHDAGLRAETFGLKPPAQSAATQAAATTLLVHFFPLEPAVRLEALGESALAALAASQSESASEIALGASIGRDAARLAMLRALNDNADEVWDARTRPAVTPGVWRGTPPLDSAHPQEPLAGNWQTWALKNGGELQPPPPLQHDSEAFLLAAKEVLAVGRNLTPEQKRIADFWHLDQGSITPPGLWNGKALELAERSNLTESSRLRLLSALNTAMLDASIACWQAKYTWWLQRPVTTIHVHLDKTFMPYLVTPPHPSYVSAHATVSGAAAEVLKHYFPKDIDQIDAWAEEAALSRLYGGIHYRFDNVAGLELGRRIGKTVLERTPWQLQSR